MENNYGRLHILYKTNKKKSNKVLYRCRCDCGNEIEVPLSYLTSGDTKSCGCLKSESTSKRMKTHGMSKTRFYRIWAGMVARCETKSANGFNIYGGRGIIVCDRWHKFENFKEDMYESYLDHCEKFGEKNTSIDRINSSCNYEPQNCRWATKLEQSRNTSRNVNIDNKCIAEICKDNNVPVASIVYHMNKGLSIYESIELYKNNKNKLVISEYCRKHGLKPNIVRSRLHRGWTFDEATTIPLGERRRR